MIDISLNKIKKNYGLGEILDDVSLEIHQGEKVALIGDNGSGKSTILKLIMKEENPNSGVIALRKGLTIGYLSQNSNLECEDILVKDLLSQSIANVTLLAERLERYEKMIATTTGIDLDKLMIKYTNAQEEYLRLSGYELSETLGKIVNGFKIEKLLDSYFYQL